MVALLLSKTYCWRLWINLSSNARRPMQLQIIKCHYFLSKKRLILFWKLYLRITHLGLFYNFQLLAVRLTED